MTGEEMNQWYMMTVIGRDRPGIVASVTHVLYQEGCNLGEASMLRLGGNFTMMMMVGSDVKKGDWASRIKSAVQSLGLVMHVDRIEGELHSHTMPDVRISVSGADRSGIVARVTTVLFEAGLDISDLSSDVAGSEKNPIYIMHIEGQAGKGQDTLRKSVEVLVTEGIDVRISSVEPMIG